MASRPCLVALFPKPLPARLHQGHRADHLPCAPFREEAPPDLPSCGGLRKPCNCQQSACVDLILKLSECACQKQLLANKFPTLLDIMRRAAASVDEAKDTTIRTLKEDACASPSQRGRSSMHWSRERPNEGSEARSNSAQHFALALLVHLLTDRPSNADLREDPDTQQQVDFCKDLTADFHGSSQLQAMPWNCHHVAPLAEDWQDHHPGCRGLSEYKRYPATVDAMRTQQQET